MYSLVVYPEAQDQLAALPTKALLDYAEVQVLEVSPWNGPPQNKNNPDGAVRLMAEAHTIE